MREKSPLFINCLCVHSCVRCAGDLTKHFTKHCVANRARVGRSLLHLAFVNNQNWLPLKALKVYLSELQHVSIYLSMLVTKVENIFLWHQCANLEELPINTIIFIKKYILVHAEFSILSVLHTHGDWNLWNGKLYLKFLDWIIWRNGIWWWKRLQRKRFV